MISPFEEFLLELAKALEFDHLGPDRQGACLIVMKEDQTSLLFEYDESLVPHHVLVSSEICPIPSEISSAVLEEALVSNFVLEATLSCKPDSNHLYLHYRFHPKIDSAEIKSVIDNILTQIRQWRQKVKDLLQSPQYREETPELFKIHKFKV